MRCPHCNKPINEWCFHWIDKYHVGYFSAKDGRAHTSVSGLVDPLTPRSVLKFDGLVLLDSAEKIERLALLK
jgi:hypothetical protein